MGSGRIAVRNPLWGDPIAFNRILSAKGFSQPPKIDMRCAAGLAHHYGAKLYLLTVVETGSFELAGPRALNEAIGLTWEDIRSSTSFIFCCAKFPVSAYGSIASCVLLPSESPLLSGRR